MSREKEKQFLEDILKLLEAGHNQIEVVDDLEDDLFEYLNVLESFYIHLGKYGADMIVANAKEEVDVDPEMVKEILEEIPNRDDQGLIRFIKGKIQRYES